MSSQTIHLLQLIINRRTTEPRLKWKVSRVWIVHVQVIENFNTSVFIGIVLKKPNILHKLLITTGAKYTIMTELVINGLSNISLIESNLTSAISRVLNVSKDSIEMKTQEQYFGNGENGMVGIPNNDNSNPWNHYDYDMMGRATMESTTIDLIIKIPHDKDLVIQIEILLSTSFVQDLNNAIGADESLSNITVISVSGSTTKVCFELKDEA